MAILHVGFLLVFLCVAGGQSLSPPEEEGRLLRRLSDENVLLRRGNTEKVLATTQFLICTFTCTVRPTEISQFRSHINFRFAVDNMSISSNKNNCL